MNFCGWLKKKKISMQLCFLNFGVGRNIALRILPAARNSVFLTSAFPFHSMFFLYVSSSIWCRVWWTANHDFHFSLHELFRPDNFDFRRWLGLKKKIVISVLEVHGAKYLCALIVLYVSVVLW